MQKAEQISAYSFAAASRSFGLSLLIDSMNFAYKSVKTIVLYSLYPFCCCHAVAPLSLYKSAVL